MKVVYKYQIVCNDIVKIMLPIGTMILRLDVQNTDSIVLWALVDPKEEMKEEVLIRIAGTGHIIKENVRYINTFMMYDRLWFHAFRLIP